MDGITMTVEICVDHAAKSALTAYLASIASGSQTLIPSGGSDKLEQVRIPTHQAQISLVSSAGMSVSADSLVLTDGGTILLQDGLENGLVRKFWQDENDKRLHRTQFEGGSEAVSRISVVRPTEVYFEYEIRRAMVENQIYIDGEWTQELDKVFTTRMYEPTIAVYEPTAIAEVY
jgi:hypothetical protein